MGTGKTAVGQALAKKKKLQFVDLDELIELREKGLFPISLLKRVNPIFVR